MMVITNLERCLRLVRENNTSNEGKVVPMLEKFPVRERDVLKNPRKRYLGDEQRYG